MANHILRLDLSSGARDFQQVALEPGLPMLDRTGANYSILRRWLGRHVAEPAWEANQTVHCYVRDEERGRLTQAVAEPVTKADLQGPFKSDLSSIRDRLKKIKPASATEQVLHRLATQAVGAEDSLPVGYDWQWFKYRDASGAQKLVWCWGYQRKDQAPATATICHSAPCRQLLVSRAGAKNRCPSCSTVASRATPSGLLRHRMPTVAAVLLLILAVLGVVAWQTPPKLIVTPATWKTWPGGTMPYKVVEQRWYVLNEDVTAQVVPQSHDRRIVEFDPVTHLAKAKTTGLTQVTLRYKDRKADANVEVGRPRTPKSIAITPATVQLAQGATSQLKLTGNYDDGSSMELTDTAEWEAKGDAGTTVRKGLVQSSNAGTATVIARYRARPGDEWQEAVAHIEIAAASFKSLAASVTPAKLSVGQSGTLQVTAVDELGQEHSVSGAAGLKVEFTPPELALITDGYVQAKSAGNGKIKVTLGDLSQSTDLEVVADDRLASGVFSVEPSTLKLAVSETAKLDVATSSEAPIETTSSDPNVVKVVGKDQVVAIGPGTASVTLTQGDKKQTVEVKVMDAALASLRIMPQLVSVRVGEIVPIQVFAADKDGKEVEIGPGLLKWVEEPSPDKASFDDVTLRVAGLSPTTERAKLTAQLGSDLTASAEVEVLASSMPTELASNSTNPAATTDDGTTDSKDGAGKDPAGSGSGDRSKAAKGGLASSGKQPVGKKPSGSGSGIAGNGRGGVGGVGNGNGGLGGVGTGNGGVGTGGVGHGGVGTTGVGPGSVGSVGHGYGGIGHGIARGGHNFGVGHSSHSGVRTTGPIIGTGTVGTDVVHSDTTHTGTIGTGTIGTGVVGSTALAPGTVVTAPVEVIDVKPDVNLAVQEVKLVSLKVTGITRISFVSSFEIAVTDTGDYRVIDAKGNALSDWVRISGGDTVTLNVLAVPRTFNDEYELYVERKIGVSIKRFQTPFKLRADK